MKNLLTKFDRFMIAVTFAEADEQDLALRMLHLFSPRPQRKGRIKTRESKREEEMLSRQRMQL